MDHLREEGRDVPGDLAPQRLGGASPDAFGPDEHAATSLSSARAISSRIASTESLLSPASGGRGTRLVAASGSFSSARPRWATRAWPTAPLARDPLTDTTGNRRPKRGCPGSVTSISATSPSPGFWKGVPTDVLVRHDQPRLAGPVRRAPDRRPQDRQADPEVARGRGARGGPADRDRGGDAAGRGHQPVPGELLPALRLRPVGPAVASPPRDRRHDRRALRGRHHRRLRAPARRGAVPARPRRPPRPLRARPPPRQDAADRVRTARHRAPPGPGPRQAGDLRLPRVHALLRDPAERRRLRAGADAGPRADAGEAARDQGAAPGDPPRRGRGAGPLARPGPARLARLLRRADERPGDHGLPAPRGRTLAPRPPAPGPAASATVAPDEGARRALPALPAPPAPVAGAAVPRHPSEVGARCGSPARRDLCGGRPAMAVPTATSRCGTEVPSWKWCWDQEHGEHSRCSRSRPSASTSPRTCSRSTAPTRKDGRCSGGGWRARRCASSPRTCRPASSAWRRARPPTTGPGSWPSSATPSG